MIRRTPKGTICAVPGCGKPLGPTAREFCSRSCAQRGNSKNSSSLSEELQKFWSRVQKTDKCWIWTGARSADGEGYGRCNLNHLKQLAHRVSWQIHNGPIPDGLFVCHTCDNPGCVRPDHLFLGTNQDNMRDMISKGRQSRGDSHRRKIIEGLMKRLT